MQLLLQGNRVVGYGEDFLDIGRGILCPETGVVRLNCTLVTACSELPNDIDSAGYEYHAGDFIPCAPYGRGQGTLAAFGVNCKKLIDTGIESASLSKLGRFFQTAYTGTNSSTLILTCGFRPALVIIQRVSTIQGQYPINLFVASGNTGYGLYMGVAAGNTFSGQALSTEITATGIKISGATNLLNGMSQSYTAVFMA